MNELREVEGVHSRSARMLSVWACFALIAFPRPVEASDTSKLTVQVPAELQRQYPDGFVETSALFGQPDYGSSITATLARPPVAFEDACKPFESEKLPKPWVPQFVIALVTRGSCTFVTKVRNAQRAGARAVVVTNNVYGSLPFMADDGTGINVQIPAMLITKEDGDTLRQMLDNNSTIILSMSWNMPVSTSVDWEFWTSSGDQASISLKRNFGEAEAALGARTTMTPHYYVYPGFLSDCMNDGLPCGDLCSNSGRYCAHGAVSLTIENTTGVQILQENLRQLCMWQSFNHSHDSLWWTYVSAYQTNCTTKWGEACSYSLMRNLSIDVQSVQQCVVTSGGADMLGGVNSLFERELNTMFEKGVFFLPTVVINGVAYRGTVNCPAPVTQSRCNVFRTICDAFTLESSPAACGVCGIYKRLDACNICGVPSSPSFNRSCAGCDGIPHSNATLDACGTCGGPGPDLCGSCLPLGHPKRVNTSVDDCPKPPPTPVPLPAYKRALAPWEVALIVLSAIVLVAVAVFFFVRRQQRAMRNEVDDLLKRYMPLRNTQGRASVSIST